MRVICLSASIAVFAALAVCSCENKPQEQNQEQPRTIKHIPLTMRYILEQRHSARKYKDHALNEAMVKDILWAANGVTRKDGRRTAPSAINAQDIDLYVCTAEGVSKYTPDPAGLKKVSDEDIRPLFKAQNEFVMKAPVTILLISDLTKFGGDADPDKYMRLGLIDAGIVSENISLYCTAVGLGTVCCAPPMETEEIQASLGLTEDQVPVLYHPIGYSAD